VKVNNLTREEAIEKCKMSQPGRYEYNMFTYRRWDVETILKCASCGHRSLMTPEQVWRRYRKNCPNPACNHG